MAIYRLLEETAFDDRVVKAMTIAYEGARRELEVANRPRLPKDVAMEIIEAAKLGELDPISMKKRAVGAVRDRTRLWPESPSPDYEAGSLPRRRYRF